MSKPRNTRERSLDQKVRGGLVRNHATGATIADLRGNQYTLGVGRQRTVSEGHAVSQDGKYREGGPFYTIRMQQHVGIRDVSLRKSKVTNRDYDGPIYLPPPSIDISDKAMYGFRSEDTSDLDTYGATAIAQCSPTNPVSNLGTGIAEIFREGFPTLPGVQAWKRRLETIKAAGSEFLNAEFGWLPLLNEVHEVRDAVKHHLTLIQQYERDANRQIRRSFVYPEEHSEHSVTSTGRARIVSRSDPSWDSVSPSTVTTRFEVTRRRWFDGAFVHPPLDKSDIFSGLYDAESTANHLFGTTITPKMLWELTPWSWAVDYFTNAGDVVTNLQNLVQYGLVMRYGYMMEESIEKVTNSISSSGLDREPGVSAGACPDSWVLIKSKVRRAANPFGFGYTGSDLSPTQWAILAAVGISLL